jgi:hypothetical protein
MSRQLTIANLQEANSPKIPEAPLQTAVVHSKHSAAFDRLWIALVRVQLAFLNPVYGHADRLLTASDRKRQQVFRRLDEITKVIRRCEVFVEKLGSANRSDQDERERNILSSFLLQQAIPFVEFWREKILAIESGVPLEIDPKTIPIWFDEMLRLVDRRGSSTIAETAQ